MRHTNPPTSQEKLSQLMDGEWHELNPSDCVADICGDDAMRKKWARYHLIRDVMKNEPVGSDEVVVSRICAAIADEPSYSNITPFSPVRAESAGQEDKVAGSDDGSDQASSNTPKGNAASIVDQIPATGVTSGKRSLLGTGIAGFAVAASVAVVTVVGMNTWQVQKTPEADNTVAAVSSAAALDGRTNLFQQEPDALLPEVELVANTGSFWMSPQTRERVEVQNEQRLNMLLGHHFENSPTADREGLLPYSRLVGYEEIGQER